MLQYNHQRKGVANMRVWIVWYKRNGEQEMGVWGVYSTEEKAKENVAYALNMGYESFYNWHEVF